MRQVLVREGQNQWRKRFGTQATFTPERPCRPPIHWLPTEDMLADMLTKKLKPEMWWATLKQGTLKLPLRMI